MSERWFMRRPPTAAERASASSAARMARWCVVESGPDGPGGLAEHFGDLRRLVAEVVAKDEDRSLLRHEPAECPIQLVAIADGQELVGRGRTVDGEHAQVRDPAALAAARARCRRS